MLKNQYRLVKLTVLTWCFLLVMTDGALADGWKLLQSVDGKRVMLKIKGKRRSYWKLDRDNPIAVRIKGETEIKVYTRMELKEKQKEGIYSFITYIDGKQQPLIARATQYSTSAKIPWRKDHRLGQSRVIYYNVPDGEHEYRFTVQGDSENVIYFRFLVPDQKTEDVSYVAYLPCSFPEEVRITVKEREYIYYRTNISKYIEIEVIGPTKVKCVSRLEFNHTMRGNKPYRVQVAENDKVVLTDFFNAVISGTANYSTKSDKVLGKGDIFFIDVPEGRHRYRISTPDPDISVIFRFYLPEKDLGNEDSSTSTAHVMLGRF